MRTRILLLVCAVSISTGCSYSKKQVLNVDGKPPSNFSVVDVKGDININLHTGYAKPSVVLTGDPEDLSDVKVRVSPRGILFITKSNKSPHGPINADIRSRYLNGFAYVGKGTIKGDNLNSNLERLVVDNKGTTTLGGRIRLGYLESNGPGYMLLSGVLSPHLRVKLTNGAQVKITGSAALRSIDADDNSWFSLSWVNSSNLEVNIRNKAYVQLAGVANKMEAELWDYSQLNVRYLRARRVFVKTHDNSVAKISATHHQHVLATDASDIREYSLPKIKSDFMALDGAVLSMRALNTTFVEEPTPYNH